MKKLKGSKQKAPKVVVDERVEYNCFGCKGEGLVGQERCISCAGTGKV